jgi:hypothetical protein
MTGDMALKAMLYDIGKRLSRDKHEREQQQRLAIVEAVKRHGKLYQAEDAKSFGDAYFFCKEKHVLRRLVDDRFKAWLATLAGISRNDPLFVSVHSDLMDEALNAGKPIDPKRYWYTDWQNGKWIATYISNGSDSLVKISRDDVKLHFNGRDDVIFQEGYTLPEWKETTPPADPFEACKMFSGMKTSDQGREILRLWCFSLLLDLPNKPPLVAYGAPGSGKTSAIKGIFHLFGLPCRITGAKKEQSGADEFWVSMDDGGLFCLDNCDTDVKWIADEISLASTGGAVERRKKYSDSVIVRLKARAALAITTTHPTFASDGAAADRSLVIRMQSRDKGDTAESSLYDEIKEKRDGCLSFLANAIRGAMIDDADPPKGLNRRHPDWAKNAWKIGRAISRQDEAEKAIRAAEDDKSIFALEQDQVGLCILSLVRNGERFDGTSTEFLAKMRSALGEDEVGEYWTSPRIGKRLGKLKEIVQNIASYGCHAAKGKTIHSIVPRVGDVGDKGDFPENFPHAYTGDDFCQNAPFAPTSPTIENVHEIDDDELEDFIR